MLTHTEKAELTKRVTEYAAAEMMTNCQLSEAEKREALRAASIKLQLVYRYIEEIS